MKRLLIIFILCIVSLNIVNADLSYSVGSIPGGGFDIYGFSTQLRFAGQTFECMNGNNTITGSNLYLGAKTGSPHGMTMELWLNDFQSGTLLKTKYNPSTNVNASAINYWRFDSSYECTVGKQYTLKFYCSGGTCASGSNFWDMNTDGSNPFNKGYVLYVGNSLNTTYDNRTTHDLTMNITYSVAAPTGINPASVFINAYPNLTTSDLNFIYNVSFNMSNGTTLFRNDSTIFINYSLNGTGDLSNYALNGTIYKGFQTKSASRINADIVNFSFDEKYFYYGIYNYNQSLMEITPHISYDCNATSLCLYNTEFVNFTSQQNNYLEIDISFTGLGSVTNLYSIGICNAPNISNPLLSSNCTLLKQSSDINISHSHTLYGNHSVIGFLFNNSRVNNLYLSDRIWIYTYFANTPTKRYLLNVIPNKTRDNAFVRINPLTSAVTEINYTPDMHIHQNNSKFVYKGCFYDTGNNLICSNLITQNIGFLDVVYNNPIFLFPNSTINNISNSNNTLILWNSPLNSANATLKNFTLYRVLTNGSYLLLNASTTFENGYYWQNSENLTDVHFKIDVCFSDDVCVTALSSELDFNYFDSEDTSLNTYWLQQINNNLIMLNEGISMLWFIIMLLGSAILPYILSREAKRTLLYIGVVLLAMLFYVNEFMNYFNLEFGPQRFFDIIILAVIVIHVINLFED